MKLKKLKDLWYFLLLHAILFVILVWQEQQDNKLMPTTTQIKKSDQIIGPETLAVQSNAWIINPWISKSKK